MKEKIIRLLSVTPMDIIRRCRSVMQYAAQRGKVNKYIKEHQVKGLQIGAAFLTLDNWLNTDLYPAAKGILYMNALKKFPFKDNTFDYVFSEHCIEHFTHKEGLFVLGECFRVMKPGGSRIRLATPDIRAILALYDNTPVDGKSGYISYIASMRPETIKPHPVFVINTAFREWGHKFLYDFDVLKESLETAGFVNVKLCRTGESDDPNLRNIEVRTQLSPEINKYEAMAVEAEKP